MKIAVRYVAILFAGALALAAAPVPPMPPQDVPPPPLAPEVRPIVKALHDRKATLKDFTAKVDYSVYHPVTDDESGKVGTVDFIQDPAKGPIFTVDFTDNTEPGKPNKSYHQQVIFDGTTVTTLDFVAKQFTHSVVLQPGAQPGAAVTLTGPLPLPIGIDEADVARNFDVTIVPNAKETPAPAADCVTLRLIPRPGVAKFDFRQMDIVFNKTMELPVQLKQTAKSKDVTTITLTGLVPNTGKAKMADANPPKDQGWTERVLNNATAPAPGTTVPLRLP